MSNPLTVPTRHAAVVPDSIDLTAAANEIIRILGEEHWTAEQRKFVRDFAPALADALRTTARLRKAWEKIFDYAMRNGLEEPIYAPAVDSVIRLFDTWRGENEFYRKQHRAKENSASS